MATFASGTGLGQPTNIPILPPSYFVVWDLFPKSRRVQKQNWRDMVCVLPTMFCHIANFVSHREPLIGERLRGFYSFKLLALWEEQEPAN